MLNITRIILRFVITGTDLGRIMLWDTDTGGFIRELVGHKQGVMNFAFSPDGSYLGQDFVRADIPGRDSAARQPTRSLG